MKQCEGRVEKLAPELGGGLIMSMDVTKQDEIDGVSPSSAPNGGLDGVVHSIGYARAMPLPVTFSMACRAARS